MFILDSDGVKDDNLNDVNKDNAYNKARPWVRYFARYIDITLAGLFIGIFQMVFFPSLIVDEKGLGFLVLIIWNFVEAQLLSSWGFTPGKWLLKVKVRDSSNNKLSFLTALKRSFLVWVVGLGIGILSLITTLIAYGRLEGSGTTYWDRSCDSIVTNEKIGVVRTIITIIYFIGFIFLISLGMY